MFHEANYVIFPSSINEFVMVREELGGGFRHKNMDTLFDGVDSDRVVCTCGLW